MERLTSEMRVTLPLLYLNTPWPPLLFSLLHPYLTTIDFPLLLPPSLHLSIMLSTIFSPGGIRFRMLLCVDIQVWPFEYFSLWEEKNSGSVRMCTCGTSKCVWCKAFIVLHKLSTYLSSSPLFYPSLHTLSFLSHTHTNTLSLFPLWAFQLGNYSGSE